MPKTPLKALSLAVLTLATFALGAYAGGAATTALPMAGQQAMGAHTLPEMLDNTDGLQTIAEAIKVAGVAGTFAGKASFTLLAPEDYAFADAGDPDSKLITPGNHAALVTLIRDHTLAGHFTPKAIDAAIAASKDGRVTLTTLGGTRLTFARSGRAITVTAPDGSHAQIDGDPVPGGSSIAIPITGVLKRT